VGIAFSVAYLGLGLLQNQRATAVVLAGAGVLVIAAG
jgi:hypothetical protein